MIRRTTAVVLGAALVLASCSDDDSAPADAAAPTTRAPVPTVTLPPPEGLPAFYGVPDPIPDADPGTVLRTEAVDAPDVHGTVQRIMYVSRSLHDEPIAVTGVVAVPSTPAPPDGYPVVAWAHGTTGIADACAPSLQGAAAVPMANLLLDAGYLLVGTDYEGLGTPGRHPYIVGPSEGRSVLDSVRAAHHLDGVDVSDRYAVWGHSQGGHAAMFALHLAAEYAPELQLVGAVAGAPPSQFNLLNAALQNSPYRYYLLMVAAAWNGAYGDEVAPLDAVLTPPGVEAVDLVDVGCDVAGLTADLDLTSMIAADPATVPAWQTLLDENDPRTFARPAPAPLLIIHGGNDEQIPTAASQLMFDQLCAVGQDETRWVYPGQSHAGVVGPSLQDMLRWIDHRFAGEPTPDPMLPTGQTDVAVQRCPA